MRTKKNGRKKTGKKKSKLARDELTRVSYSVVGDVQREV